MASTRAMKMHSALIALEATHANVLVDILIHPLQMDLLVRISMNVGVVLTTVTN